MTDEKEFESSLLREYRSVSSSLTDAQNLITELQPKFERLRSLIKLYGLEEELVKDEYSPDSDGAKTKGQRISDLSEEYLLKRGNEWTPSSKLYIYLADSGLSIGGKNPASTLSAHLSNSNRFESDRAKGWRLKKSSID